MSGKCLSVTHSGQWFQFSIHLVVVTCCMVRAMLVGWNPDVNVHIVRVYTCTEIYVRVLYGARQMYVKTHAAWQDRKKTCRQCV